MNIPSHIKAVIFDMDGLLIDSEPYWQKADAKVFARHGKRHSPEINKQIMGMGHKQIAEHFKRKYGFEKERDALVKERKDTFYETIMGDLQLMEGAKELIQALYDQNYAMAIATSGHSTEKTAEILEKLDLDVYIPILVSGDDVKRSKPDPEIYLKAAQELHVDPKDCLVVEDAPNGAKAGKAAGMMVYGINKDKELAKNLEKEKADKVFESLKEIL